MFKVALINGRGEVVADIFQRLAPAAGFEATWLPYRSSEGEKLPLVRDEYESLAWSRQQSG